MERRGDGDETKLSDFEDYEFIETYDCCADDYIHITPNDFDVEEAFKDSDILDPEDDGWDLVDTNYFIRGPICIEPIIDVSSSKNNTSIIG